MKYPIYRKMLNGHEFAKINSDGKMIAVKKYPYRNTGLSFAIQHSDNPVMVSDFMDDDLSTVSNRDEFEKVYGKAQFQLSKSNCEQ